MPSAADERAEALRRLEERLGRASETAERLIDEVSRMTPPRPHKPPPAGWEAPPASGEREAARGTSEIEALLEAIKSARDLVPPDVHARLAAALREVLLAIRALIDFYIERLERVRREPPEVQDIPIR
jgi:hypothetical protein